MRTFESTEEPWRRIATAALAIAAVVVVAAAAQTPFAASALDRPVSKCSDFGCEK
jgi:hypothetical protein